MKLEILSPNPVSTVNPIVPSVPEPYSKHPDWIDISGALPNQINILTCDNGTGQVSFLVKTVNNQPYQVDWGDGVTDNYLHNTIASHTYVKDTGVSCSRGYTTFKAVVSAADPLSTFNLKVLPGSFRSFNNQIIGVVFGESSYTTFAEAFTNAADPYVYANLLEFVEFPQSFIGNSFYRTFVGVNNLRSVTMPLSYSQNFTLERAFFNCSNLIEVNNSEALLGDKVTTLFHAFNGCSNLSYVKFGLAMANLSTMESAFQNCYSLLSVTLPDDLPICATMVNSFKDCSALREITMPLNMQFCYTISYAFSNCYSLEAVRFPTNIPTLNNISNTFNGCRSLRTQVVPDGFSANMNASYAYKGCVSLQMVSFPTQSFSSLDYAFDTCKSLISLELAPTMASLTTMASMCNACYALQRVILPISAPALTTMANMFFTCSSLSSCSLPDAPNNTSLNSTFIGCGNLSKVVFPGSMRSVTSLNATFASCFMLNEIIGLENVGSLTTSVNCMTIAEYCENLTSLTLNCKMHTFTFYGTSGSPIKLASLNITPVSGSFASGAGDQIKVSYSNLGKEALVNLFTVLPTVASKVINITGAAGAALLTAEDRLIATNKGWTITG